MNEENRTSRKKNVDVLLAVKIDVTSIVQMPRLLKRAGCRISLIAEKGLAVQRTRFVDRHIKWPAGSGSLVEALRSHISQVEQPYSWIIIGDESLLWDLVDLPDRSWMEEWFPFSLDRGNSTNAVSNLSLMLAAASKGIPVPRSLAVDGIAEARSAASELGYPVVLKLDRGASSSGVRLAPTRKDLDRGWAEIANGTPIMVQELIEGDVGETAVLFDRGKPLCWFSSYCRRPWPGKSSISSERQLMIHGETENLVAGIGELTRFSGLCGIDWIHDPQSDQVTVIEFNPRPTPGVYMSEKMGAGVSMSRGVEGWLSGEPCFQRPSLDRIKRELIPVFPQSLFRAFGERRPIDFLRSFSVAPWDDPLLLAAQLRRFVSHYIPARWKASLRHMIHGRPLCGAAGGKMKDGQHQSPG